MPLRRTPEIGPVFSEHRAGVRAQISQLVPADEVDDIVQEVFVKVARALSTFSGKAELRTWLHQIARRTAIDHLRSRRHHERRHTISLEATDSERSGETIGHPADPAKIGPEAPSRLVRAEMHGCIQEFMRRLPAAHAEILRLKEIRGFTNAEIASRLGLTVDAAKIRLHRARAAMRALVSQDCELYRTTDNTIACDRKSGRCA